MSYARFALAGLIALPLLAACNTIEGVGQDVQAVGQGVTRAANYVERELFSPEPRQTRTASISVGRACDPETELAGGSDLPSCSSRIVRPTSTRQ